MLVLHGTADSSVPPEIAEQFVAALKVGVGGWEGGWPAGHVLEGRGGSCAALRCCCCAPSSPLVSSQTCLPHAAVALWLTHSCLRSCLLGAAAACLPACLPPQGAGVGDARLKLYVGKTHTRPIVEDPSECWVWVQGAGCGGCSGCFVWGGEGVACKESWSGAVADFWGAG